MTTLTLIFALPLLAAIALAFVPRNFAVIMRAVAVSVTFVTMLLAVMLGFSVAYQLYANATTDPLPQILAHLSRAMRNRFYFDELYEATVIKLNDLFSALADASDRWVIAGFGVRGIHGTTEIFGRALRLVQTGNLQTYAFLFVLGMAVVLWFVLGK